MLSSNNLSPISLTTPYPLSPHNPNGPRRFKDSYGRERHFQGTNVVVKGPPWLPDTGDYSPDISLSERDFEDMRAMGLNQLRLGIMWPGLEPLRGEYNYTYLDEYDQIVKKAAEYGIYTLIDGHQDAFNEYFCGEGVPDWARVTPEEGGKLKSS